MRCSKQTVSITLFGIKPHAFQKGACRPKTNVRMVPEDGGLRHPKMKLGLRHVRDRLTQFVGASFQSAPHCLRNLAIGFGTRVVHFDDRLAVRIERRMF